MQHIIILICEELQTALNHILSITHVPPVYVWMKKWKVYYVWPLHFTIHFSIPSLFEVAVKGSKPEM